MSIKIKYYDDSEQYVPVYTNDESWRKFLVY